MLWLGVLFFAASLFSTEVFTQNSILENYVQQAIQQNLAIQKTQLQRTRQLSKIDQARRMMGPSVDVSTTYLLAKGGRTLNFPIGDLLNPAYTALNELTGTNQFPTDLENTKVQLTPNNFLDAQLTISQPLIFSAIQSNIQIQQTLLQLDDLDIAIQQQEIAYQVKMAYFNYLKTIEGTRILEASENLLKEVQIFNQKLVKFDKATDEILFDVDYQLENISSQKAALQAQNQASRAFFNLLLNRELDTEILIDESQLDNMPKNSASLESLKQIALQKRLEFQKISVAKTVNSLNQKRIEKEALPTLGIRGGVGIQTENFNFDQGGPLFSVGLGLNMNLFDNGQRKKQLEEIAVDRNILENDQAQLAQKVELEVIQIYYALQSLDSQLAAQEAAEVNARKSYDRLKIKYENDKALLIELLTAQNKLTVSQLSKTLVRYDYLIKEAELTKILARE